MLITVLVVLFFSSCGEQKEHQKQQFLLKASEAYKNQNFNPAIHYLEEAIRIDSCYAPALNNLATIYYDQGNLDMALHMYERSVNCQPGFYQAAINLSNTLYDLKQYYRGLDVLKKQMSLTPDSSAIYFGMGLHLTRLRQYDSAIFTFRKAQSLDPENVEILINLGTLNYYKRKYEKARQVLNESIALKGDEPEAYNTFALISAAENQYLEAVQYLDRAIKLKREPHYLNNKGYMLLQMDSLNEAAELINQSIMIDPFNAWSYRNKGILRLRQQNPDEALKLFMRAERLDDWIEDINYYIGTAYIQKGEMTKACEYFQKGVELKEAKASEAISKYCNAI